MGDILDTRLGGGNFGQMINKYLRHHKSTLLVHIVEVAKSNFVQIMYNFPLWCVCNGY